MPNIKYRSGNFAVATPISGLRHESPLLPFLNEVLVFHRDFMQLESAFVAQDYNTINADILGPTAFLINESPREDAGGLCVRWTRSWARIPLSYDMPGGIYNYQFPGIGTGLAGERPPSVIAAKLTIHRDFFLCGNHGLDNGGFAEWQDIPVTTGFIVQNAATETPGTLDEDTTPTFEEYRALVAANTPIQIEDSKIMPIFGSIFVRENLFVIAR